MHSQPMMETYTVKDYLQWEGDWELIYGQPMAMAPLPSIFTARSAISMMRNTASSLPDAPLILIFRVSGKEKAWLPENHN